MKPKISILMLTHNAPAYVELAITSLARYTKSIDYELIVVDNASDGHDNNDNPSPWNRIKSLFDKNFIHKFIPLHYNSLFSEGNNIASRMATADASHYVLLNSDVEIKNSAWLQNLLDHHREGITAYGVIVSPPLRVDGYCLLIDAHLYRRHLLDESHQWWWAVTKLQARLLTEGYAVRGFSRHESYLHHFGGKSGSGFKGAKGMNVSTSEAASWFRGKTIEIIDPV